MQRETMLTMSRCSPFNQTRLYTEYMRDAYANVRRHLSTRANQATQAIPKGNQATGIFCTTDCVSTTLLFSGICEL
jgi:hypothetical protein